MTLGPHAGFIVASYLAAVIVIAALILWVIVDYRAQRRALAEHDQTPGERRPRP